MDMKTDKQIAVLGIFDTRSGVENCISTLKSSGFRTSDMSALVPSSEGISGSDGIAGLATEKQTKAPEGTTAGVSAGAVLGGTLGWLAGIGALAIPGVGPLIAAGPILGLLAGASVGAAVGGVTGMLIGLGIPEYEAKRYESHLKEGRFLLSVHCDDHEWKNRAKGILESCGAKDVSATSEAHVSGVKPAKHIDVDSADRVEKMPQRPTTPSDYFPPIT